MAPESPVGLPASSAVVCAVANAEGVSPLAIEQPLADAIDTDALDRLVPSMGGRPDATPGVIEFAYLGYVVTVTGDGAVDVSRP